MLPRLMNFLKKNFPIYIKSYEITKPLPAQHVVMHERGSVFARCLQSKQCALVCVAGVLLKFELIVLVHWCFKNADEILVDGGLFKQPHEKEVARCMSTRGCLSLVKGGRSSSKRGHWEDVLKGLLYEVCNPKHLQRGTYIWIHRRLSTKRL